MKFSDIISKSKVEIHDLLIASKKEMMHLRFRKSAGDMSGSGRLKELRKTVARVKTLMNTKKEI